MTADRGQTAHDFALGVGVFLLTVAFVFSTLPGLVAPFQADVTDAEATLADRVAATAVDRLSSGAGAGALDPDATAAFFSGNVSAAALRATFGLGETDHVNLTVRRGPAVLVLPAGGGTTRLAAGTADPGQPVARTVRLVAFAGGGHCDPTCRLVVEVG